MKFKEFLSSPTGEIVTGVVEGLAITGAALGAYELTKSYDTQLTIGALGAYCMTDPFARVFLGISDICDNMKGKKQWNDARF